VRARFVEGNPFLSQVTVAKTRTYRQKLKQVEAIVNPTWNDRCDLYVPSWLLQAALPEEQPSLQKPALIKGWEHNLPGNAMESVVCVDIFDHSAAGYDRLLGRALVPFRHALDAANDGTGTEPRPVTVSRLPEASLWLGFERGSDNDHFAVIVEKAEGLPVDSTNGMAAIFCVARIADLGVFFQPTDKMELHFVGDVHSKPASGSLDEPEWNWAHVLELPGCEVNNQVAARPNWYILFEVLNSDPRALDDPPLATAAASLSQILNEACAAEPAEVVSDSLQSRIRKMQVPAVMALEPKQAAVSNTRVEATTGIIRELPLASFAGLRLNRRIFRYLPTPQVWHPVWPSHVWQRRVSLQRGVWQETRQHRLQVLIIH
jgi:hypothetical protein